MKNNQEYLYKFIEKLIAFTPNLSERACASYLTILILAYTGLSFNMVLPRIRLSKEKFWFEVTSKDFQRFAFLIYIPLEFFELCREKRIDFLSSITTTVHKADLRKILAEISIGENRRLEFEDLKSIFRIACESSPKFQSAFKSRTGILSKESNLSQLDPSPPAEFILKNLSLKKIVKRS